MASLNRNVLFATNWVQSVLRSTVFGSLPLSGYTPFGWRLDEQGQHATPAFNGEIQERPAAGYLLGNGYRLFNPTLMRFQSPDNLSPFGRGGLNTYAYCGGDPINRRDDDGHIWQSLKKFFGRSGANVASPNGVQKMPAREISHPIEMLNLKQVAPRIFTFETPEGAGTRLTIYGHGTKNLPQHIVYQGNSAVNIDTLYKGLLKQGVDFRQYLSVDFMACYAAKGGSESSVARFAQLSTLDVTGPKGGVSIYVNKTLGHDDLVRDFSSVFPASAPFPRVLQKYENSKGAIVLRRIKYAYNPKTYGIRRG